MRVLIDEIAMAVYQNKRGFWYGTWRDAKGERHTRYLGKTDPTTYAHILTEQKYVHLPPLKRCVDCSAILPVRLGITGGRNQQRCGPCGETHLTQVKRKNAATWRKNNRDYANAYNRQYKKAKREQDSA